MQTFIFGLNHTINLFCTYLLYELMKLHILSSSNERKDTVSRAVISKGINALNKRCSAQEKTKLAATLYCMCSVEKEHRSKSDYKTQDEVRKNKRLKSAYKNKRMQ